MKKILLRLFFGLLLAQQLPAQPVLFNPADLNTIAETEAKAHAGKLHSPPVLAPTDNYDVVHHRIQWYVDPAVKYIRGGVHTRFRALSDGFDAIHFDLMDSLHVDSVLYHGSSVIAAHFDNVLRIQLPAGLAAGTLDSVSVYYQGKPADTGFGSFIQTAHNAIPVVWTLSQPYGARDWWPCKQTLSDKIDSLDVYVTCPAAYRSAGNGLRVAEYLDASGQKVCHWRHRYPIATYLVCMAVTDYVEYFDYADIQSGTLPIQNYVYAEELTYAQQNSPLAVPMMELFDSLFIPYPFAQEKYGHVMFGWGGGMEHQTMSFMGNFGYELIAHEMAHQWFGDYITCNSWQDIWLNEGFATYLSGLCYEFLLPNAPWWRNFRKQRINGVCSQPDGSVFVDDTTTVSRIFSGRLSYAKGAMTLHMLRWQTGDSSFFAGLRNYLNDNALANGFARTADLQTQLETASGQDLDWFFADWIYGQGFPTYHIKWDQFGDQVFIEVNQAQSHPSVSFFDNPVPLRLKTGAQTLDVRLTPEYSGQLFELNVPFAVDSVFFDPDLWLISSGNTVTKTAVSTQTPVRERLRLTPNPARERLWVTPAPGRAYERLRVYDARGTLLRQTDRPIREAFELDITALPAGWYSLELSGGEGVSSGVFVKSLGGE